MRRRIPDEKRDNKKKHSFHENCPVDFFAPNERLRESFRLATCWSGSRSEETKPRHASTGNSPVFTLAGLANESLP